MKTIHEAAVYISKSLPQDILVTVESLEEQFFDIILDRVGDRLEEKDLVILESKKDDLDFVETYLAHKLPNFHTFLDELVASYISEYMVN